MTILEQMGQKAKEAARALAVAGAKKDAALLKMADAIEAHEAEILAANEKDLQAARESGMRKSMLDRLALTSARIAGMAQGVREVAAQEDPIGQVVSGFVRPNGLQIQRVRVPLGVIGIIYEARPNVTADAPSFCAAGRRPSIRTRQWPRRCARRWKKPGCPRTASSWCRTPRAHPPSK